jgi:histidine triad (HIT) family protein
MNADPTCIFCKIVAGTVPCAKLFEDADTLAFMDINPVHDGHCLVIPKAHYPTIFATPPDVAAATARIVQRVAAAVQAALAPDGLNLVQSNGPGAAQSVPHLHFHVLPRRMGDELLINWPLKPGGRARIAEVAALIRTKL